MMQMMGGGGSGGMDMQLVCSENEKHTRHSQGSCVECLPPQEEDAGDDEPNDGHGWIKEEQGRENGRLMQ